MVAQFFRLSTLKKHRLNQYPSKMHRGRPNPILGPNWILKILHRFSTHTHQCNNSPCQPARSSCCVCVSIWRWCQLLWYSFSVAERRVSLKPDHSLPLLLPQSLLCSPQENFTGQQCWGDAVNGSFNITLMTHGWCTNFTTMTNEFHTHFHGNYT